jgi:hypothetical protein
MELAGERRQPMKVTYRQSGGLVGLSKQCDLDADEMEPADREALVTLVEQAGVRESVTARSERARDVVTHDLTIEEGGKSIRVGVDDRSAPASLRPLLKFLQKRAKAAARG